jgi:hypothetical protein
MPVLRRRSRFGVARHDLHAQRIRLQRVSVVFAGDVVDRNPIKPDRSAGVVVERRHPIRGQIRRRIARGRGGEQAANGAGRACAGVAQKVVHVRHANHVRMHDGIVWRAVAVRTKCDKLAIGLRRRNGYIGRVSPRAGRRRHLQHHAGGGNRRAEGNRTHITHRLTSLHRIVRADCCHCSHTRA